MDRTTLIESLLLRAARGGSGPEPQSVIQLADGPLEGWTPFNASDEVTVAFVSTVGDMVARIERSLVEGPTIVLAPFGRFKSDVERRDAGSQLRGNPSVAEHLLTAVTAPAGEPRLVVVTPATVLDSAGSAEFREIMCTRWHPALVIDIADLRVPSLHHSIRLAVTVWTRPASDVPITRFLSVPSAEIGAQQVLDDVGRLLGQGGGRTRFGYVLRQAIPPGASLSVRANSPEARAHEEELRRFGLTCDLTEVFRILRGRHPRELQVVSGRVADPGMLRLLGGRDVLQDGSIADSEDDTRWVEESDVTPPLQPGDLVFRGLLAPKHRRLVFSRYSPLDDPATPGPHVVVLRPRDDAPTEAVAISLAYLGSEHCKTLHDRTASSLGGHVRLSLRGLRLPRPDAALAAAVQEIEDATDHFESWRTLARDVLSSAFGKGTPTDAYAHIVASGRTLRLRAEAASSISDFSTIVRTRFPHPLSYRWRTVEATMSAGVPHAAYIEILEAAEVLLCFLAHVALAAARDVGRSIGAVASMSKKLSSRGSGPGFGDWLTILSEVQHSRSLQLETSEQHVLHDLGGLLASEPVERAVRSMKSRRDAYAHLRRPPAHALEQETREAFDDLRTTFEAALFLAETPLHAVDSTTWDSIAGTATARVRDLVGDHSVVPTRELTTESQLDSGSLHLGTQTGLILLRPYLIGRACPDCGHWSTFHADRYDGDAVALKSLERGHITPDTSQVPAFRSAGLLA